MPEPTGPHPGPTPTATPPPALRVGVGAVGYRGLFAVREFRAVFAAHAFSLLGLVVAEISLSVLVFDRTP